MKPNNLLSVGVVILALTLPATASAQRGGGHQDGFRGRGFVRPVVTAGQPVVPSTIVRPVVVNPHVIVRQPIVAGFVTRHEKFGHIGFGSVPVRTGFETPPVRTGFETAPVGAGFVVPTHPVAGGVVTGRRHGFRSSGFGAFTSRHLHRPTIIVGYPLPYPYVYAPYGFTTSSPGYSVPTVPTPVVPGAGYGSVGVSAGPSTYWTDLANQPGASSGLTFDVLPALSQVFVDGAYVGTVQDFSFDRAPLMIVPGSHRIELRAPGYRTVTLDVTTAAGQVIPYEGALQPLRSY